MGKPPKKQFCWLMSGGLMLKSSLLEMDLSPVLDYLEQSGSISIVVLDHELFIKNCNQFFMNLIESSENPIGQNLKDMLLPEDLDMFTNLPKEGYQFISYNLTSSHNNQNYMVGYLYKINNGFILFGERAWISDDQIIQEISKLNNDMANMTRELNKKNNALEKANAKITKLSRIDSLTGIANRRYFMEYFQKVHAHAARQNVPLSLVMADLDYFKKINDQFGHHTGDIVLKEFADLLQNKSRQEDLPARIGGEEFAVLLVHTGADRALTHAERLRSKLESMEVSNHNIKITACFGVANLKDGEEIAEVMKRADKALYAAKETGRNAVRLAT